VVGGTDSDPKVRVILHYLGERNWLERNGAIIFSQYRTTDAPKVRESVETCLLSPCLPGVPR
jgi:hypothetical protein